DSEWGDGAEAGAQGGGATGAALAGSTGLGGVFFTGSNPTGRAIAASAAPNMCKLQLELGGKDAVYVRADMDPAKAAAATADGAFFNNGQVPAARFSAHAVADPRLGTRAYTPPRLLERGLCVP
ncbi:hypothetical protein CYMTET_32832, partial [Cymbomonas tetramitiformis]